MPKNDFLIAWLVVATLLLIVVVGGTVFFVWRSGLLSGEVPLVELTGDVSPLFDATDESEEQSQDLGKESFEQTVYYVDPAQGLLVPEDRGIAWAPHIPGRILNVLQALHQNPETSGLVSAIPAELQFRAVFLDTSTKTVYVDLAKLPEDWENADPLEVALSLYAITQTVTGLSSNFQIVRFLVDGKETEARPGGIVLSEPFGPSEDWLAPNQR